MQLHDFCNKISAKKNVSKLSVDIIATEFISFFHIPKFIKLPYLIKLCQNLGINEISGQTLPVTMRGYHQSYKGEHLIYFKNDDWIGGVEHTILHEIYEIIIETLIKRSDEYAKFKTEHNADHFAASILMPSEDFLSDVYTSSFDILDLQKKYVRGYASILIKMKTVLTERLMFLGIIYEKVRFLKYRPNILLNHPADDFIVTYRVRTPYIKAGKSHGRLLWCSVPRKGKTFEKDSVAENVFYRGQSVFREKATGFDLFGHDDISVIGRPVHWKNELAKIIVLGVPYKSQDLFKNQIDRLNPIFLLSARQVI